MYKASSSVAPSTATCTNLWKGTLDPGGETGARSFLAAPGTSGKLDGVVVIWLSDGETSGEEREPLLLRGDFLVVDMYSGAWL